MADHNPWADAQGNQTSSQQGQQGFPQQRFYGEQQPQHPPQQQQQQQGYGSAQNYYNEPAYSQQQQPELNAWSGQQGNPPLPARHPARNAAPAHGISRSDTDDFLESQPDRAEQMEHMQAYEATALESEDDKHRAQLEKEFPDVDGSLIAALYSDTKDLSATREMLQELNRQ